MIKLEVAHKKFIDHLREQNKSSSTLIAYKKDVEQLLDHVAKSGAELVTQIPLPQL